MTVTNKLLLRQALDIPNVSNTTETSMIGTWGSAFAAAGSVQLEEVDDVFLELTRTSATPLAEMAELAAKNVVVEKKKDQRKKKDKKKKRSREEKQERKSKRQNAQSEVAASEDAASPLLEGQMVPHPTRKDEQVMILVDNLNKMVYSALMRTSNGERLSLGTLLDDGTIRWTDDAFSQDDQNDEDRNTTTFPFPTDADDHCESPLEAYQDIAALLECLFPNKNCKIYDPYYCNGAIKGNLASLGFNSVYNEKEDCYAAWASSTVPDFDVLITNPPYSEDHIPKLIDFLTSSQLMKNKPWFLLMPQWVSKKDYFRTTWDKKCFYLLPKGRRYIYAPPKDFREKKASDVHKKSSPFVSMWFVWGGDQTNALYRTAALNTDADVARSKNALRDLRRKTSKQKR